MANSRAEDVRLYFNPLPSVDPKIDRNNGVKLPPSKLTPKSTTSAHKPNAAPSNPPAPHISNKTPISATQQALRLETLTRFHIVREQLSFTTGQEGHYAGILDQMTFQLEREEIGTDWARIIRANGIEIINGDEMGNPELEVWKQRLQEVKGLHSEIGEKVQTLRREANWLRGRMKKIKKGNSVNGDSFEDGDQSVGQSRD